MNVDLHSKGANFKRDLLSDVRDMVVGLLSAVSATVGAQQEGTVISNEHRVLNFTGAGVTVSDDRAARRTNIDIPGAPSAISATTIVSTAGAEKVFPLTAGAISGAPANWQTTGFSDSGWANSVQMTVNTSAFFVIVPGTQWISDQAGSVSTPAGCLVRRTFTLPAGTIASAELLINVDDNLGTENSGVGSMYLNGASIGSAFSRTGTPTNYATITLSPSQLVAGGSNVLALHDFNPPGATGPHAVSYKLTVTYTGAGIDPQYIPKSIIAAKGDVIIGASVAVPATVSVGTDGQVLTARSTATDGVDWETPASGGMADPTTTKGDLIVRGTSSPNRLSVGTDGQVLTARSTATNGVDWEAPASSPPYVNVQDQKTQNTGGGTFTSGAWQTRDLNTIVSDTGSIASLSSNQITLPAGTYRCRISAPAFGVLAHQARLRNVTDGTTLLPGTTEYSGRPTDWTTSRSIISGTFTLSGTRALSVQHQCAATSIYAQAANFGTEVYTVAEFWKLS